MMKSELLLEVRYYETDQMGVVHHSNYIRYFECGRSDMLKKAGLPVEKIEQEGVMMPIVNVECKYRFPARLGDTLRVVSLVEAPPKARLIIRSEIYNQEGTLLCDGSVTLGFISSETRRPVRCPESLSRLFEQYI